LLSVINIITGFATAGINLSLTNIGLKLAPKQDAIVYLSAKNIVTALFSSIAPVFGGWLADILANSQFNWTLKLKTAEGVKELHVIALGQWNFLFLIGALLALFSIKLLKRVQETGEVEKTLVVKVLRSDLRNSLTENFVVSYLINWPVTVSARIKKLSTSSDKSKAEDKPEMSMVLASPGTPCMRQWPREKIAIRISSMTRRDFSANLNDVFRTQAVGLRCYLSVFFGAKNHLS